MKTDPGPPCPRCEIEDPMCTTGDFECYSCGFPLFPDPRAFRYLSASDLFLVRFMVAQERARSGEARDVR